MSSLQFWYILLYLYLMMKVIKSVFIIFYLQNSPTFYVYSLCESRFVIYIDSFSLVKYNYFYIVRFVMKNVCIYFKLSIMLLLSHSVVAEDSAKDLTEREQWLKTLFSKQHEELIPKVAVADMFFACNIENNNEFGNKSLPELINNESKERLAEKLTACLNGVSVKSEQAINYSLLGCFHDQFKKLSDDEKNNKIQLVKQAIASLDITEKKKSLSQCVTDQAITYLK